MNWPAPVLVFSGRLGDRTGNGRPACPAPVMRFAGWSRLADERFRLEGLEPPSADWAAVAGLDGETNEPGACYLGAVAYVRTAARRVVLHRPEADGVDLVADVGLRRALSVGAGERVHVSVYRAADWRDLPPWGYHHMCG